ncbi:MAG: hypothetical protein ACXW39_10065 [Nitrospira sp.]
MFVILTFVQATPVTLASDDGASSEPLARNAASSENSAGGGQHPEWLAASAATGGGGQGEGGLTRWALAPWPTNPRYWQYNGHPTLFLGGSVRDSIFQLSTPVLRRELDTMLAAGGNYLRNTMSDRKISTPGASVYAFKQVSDGKYDLNQWNETYWNRFSTMLQETARRDILVQIELWDIWDFISVDSAENDLPTGNPRWYAHPWNPRNNINYTTHNTRLPETWNIPMGDPSESTMHPIMKTTPGLNNDPVVVPYQEAFVAKVLSHTLQYDHVIYQIANEHWGNISWSNYWAEFIHRQAGHKGKTVYITESRHTPTVAPVQNYPHLYNFADISQSALKSGEAHMTVIRRSFEQTEASPLPLNSTKQYGADNAVWADSSDEGVDRVVRSVFGGQAAVRFHRPPYGLGNSPLAQNVIKSLRMMEREIDLFNNVLPHSVPSIRGLLGFRSDNEAYIMADPGRAYAVYFPNGGSVTLNTSVVDGSMTRKWINVEKGTWGPTTMANGALQTLAASSTTVSQNAPHIREHDR